MEWLIVLVKWDDSPVAVAMRTGASRRVVSGQHSTVVRIVTEPDAIFNREEHRHRNEQWLIVLRGLLRIVCDDQECELSVGDVAFFPASSWHAAVSVGPEGCDYLEVSAPARLDLLPGALMPSPLEFRSPAACDGAVRR